MATKPPAAETPCTHVEALSEACQPVHAAFLLSKVASPTLTALAGSTLQVIVQGLPFAFAWQELKDLFKPVGGVLKADIVMGQDGRSKGWGTVNFETEADAAKAVEVCHLRAQECAVPWLNCECLTADRAVNVMKQTCAN